MLMFRNRFISAALVAAGAVVALSSGQAAHAQAFTYANTTTPAPFVGTGGVLINVFNTAATVNSALGNSQTDIVLFNLNNASTNTSVTPGTISVNYTTSIAFTSGGQTLTRTLTGTFSGTNVSPTSGDYNNVFTGTFNNGVAQSPLVYNFTNGNTVTLSAFNFAPPPPTGGGFGAVTTTALLSVVSTGGPEPGTFVLMGTGLMSAAGMVVRRRRIAKK